MWLWGVFVVTSLFPVSQHHIGKFVHFFFIYDISRWIRDHTYILFFFIVFDAIDQSPSRVIIVCSVSKYIHYVRWDNVVRNSFLPLGVRIILLAVDISHYLKKKKKAMDIEIWYLWLVYTGGCRKIQRDRSCWPFMCLHSLELLLSAL